MHLLAGTVDDLKRELQRVGAHRSLLRRRDDGSLEASPTELEPLAQALAQSDAFHDHEAIFLEIGRTTGALHGAFVHRTIRGQAAGGLRHWPYRTLFDYLRDGLRLSRGMTHKNALAGLWWGGGKGVIAQGNEARTRDPAYRRLLYREYGAFVSSLGGAYVTAEDVGTRPEDMASVFAETRFTTCVPESVGGSGNPSPHTATGVVCAMEGALSFLGQGALTGKRVAMQGAGNVGSAMIGELLARGVGRIVVGDISEERLAKVRARFPVDQVELRQVDEADPSLYTEQCDILAPNALGAGLNPATIPLIQARIVCGAANNQLEDEDRDDRALFERGLVYVPDFLANRMGIVNCANEQYGVLAPDPAVTCHFSRDYAEGIFQVTGRVLRVSRERGIPTGRAAIDLAEEASRTPHPVWGHRAKLIIDACVRNGWANRVPRDLQE